MVMPIYLKLLSVFVNFKQFMYAPGSDDLAPSVTSQMDSGNPRLISSPVSQQLKLPHLQLIPEGGVLPFPGLGTPLHHHHHLLQPTKTT